MENVMSKKFMFTDSIGFENLGDFLGSITSYKIFKTTLPILGIMFSGMLAILDTFIGELIYEPPTGIAILLLVNLLDTFLGMGAAIKKRRKIKANLIVRSLVRFCVQAIFIAILFNSHKLWGFLIYKIFVDSLLMVFIFGTFWSAVENAKILGFVSEEQYSFLEKLVSLRVILDKIWSMIGERKGNGEETIISQNNKKKRQAKK